MREARTATELSRLRALAVASLLAASVTPGACASAGAALQETTPLTLKVGDTASIGGTAASLTFEGVASDSRCPRGARCIRAGEAAVRLRLRGDRGETTPVTLSVPPGSGAAATAQGYRIEVLGLDPQVEAEREIAPGDYVVTVQIQEP